MNELWSFSLFCKFYQSLPHGEKYFLWLFYTFYRKRRVVDSSGLFFTVSDNIDCFIYDLFNVVSLMLIKFIDKTWDFVTYFLLIKNTFWYIILLYLQIMFFVSDNIVKYNKLSLSSSVVWEWQLPPIRWHKYQIDLNLSNQNWPLSNQTDVNLNLASNWIWRDKCS